MFTTRFFRKACAAAALGFVIAATGAMGQQAAPPAPAPAPAPAPVAPAPVVTDAQLNLGRQIVTGSGLSRSFEAVIPQMLTQINQQITRTRPELAVDLKVVLTGLITELTPQTSKMTDTAARIFASKLSEGELKDVATFFNSPSGKKYVQAQPVALDEIVVSMDGWRQQLAQTMTERVKAEMKKKGHDL